jgi:UPF0755 protein
MSEDLDPEKYHVMTPKKKKILTIVLLVLFFIVIPVLSFFYYKSAVFRPSQTSKEANFEIKSGDSVFEIASMLYDKEAINSEFLFILYTFLNKPNVNIQAGTYKIPAGTSLVELVNEISHGRNDTSLTFLEGWRVEQYAITASRNLPKVDYQRFVEMAKPHEGYLFPDTYFFNRDSEEEDVLEILTQTFEEKTKNILTEDNLEKAGLTKEQAVIFASMVEREVSKEEDRPIVAGILIKRWREGMKLDVDATTQYSVVPRRLCNGQTFCVPSMENISSFNWWPKDLTEEELKTNDPYNTRVIVGLPPAPICNPGLSAILSVLNYENTPYYYYLTGKDGVTRYAKTISEHNQNIAKYLTD